MSADYTNLTKRLLFILRKTRRGGCLPPDGDPKFSGTAKNTGFSVSLWG